MSESAINGAGHTICHTPFSSKTLFLKISDSGAAGIFGGQKTKKNCNLVSEDDIWVLKA